MRRNRTGLVDRATFDVHRTGTGVSSRRRFMNTFEASAERRGERPDPKNAARIPSRRGKQVLHLVEKQDRPPVSGKQPLGEAKLLHPLMPARFAAFGIRLANQVERRSQTGGQGLAELSLACPRRSMDEHVDALLTASQRSFQEPFEMIAVRRPRGRNRTSAVRRHRPYQATDVERRNRPPSEASAVGSAGRRASPLRRRLWIQALMSPAARLARTGHRPRRPIDQGGRVEQDSPT